MKKRITVILAAAAVVLCTGCGSFTARSHAKAIDEQFEKMIQESGQFCHFTCDGLSKQLKEQKQDGNKKDQASYTVTVTVPDITRIEHKAVTVKAPEVDINEPNMEGFSQDYITAAKEVLEKHVVDNGDLAGQEKKLKVTLQKKDNKWTAQLDAADVDLLKGGITEGMDSKAEELMLASLEYSKVKIASSKEQYLQTAFPESAYRASVRLEDIAPKDGGGYLVKVCYADPEKVYATVFDSCYKDYEKKGKVLYTALDAAAISQPIADKIPGAVEKAGNDQQGTFTVSEEYATDEEMKALEKKIVDVRSEKMQSTLKKINKKCVIPEKKLPKTSVVSGKNSGQSITVKSKKAVGDRFVTFYKISGKNLDDKGKKVLSAMIRAGDSLTVRLPSGNYKMIQGSGEKWYGEKKAFGPSGYYQQTNQVLEVKSNYSYTLTLYGVQDGNLSNSSINYPY